MKKHTKTKRFAVRMLPELFARLDRAAKNMGTTLGDLMIIGALAITQRAHNTPEYLHHKAQVFSDESESDR